MQLGSGTFDAMPGLTYLGQSEDWSWGGQGIGTIRLGRNSAEYSLGDRLDVTAWGARKWSDWLSTSLRVSGHFWSNIDGADPELNPAMIPTADPDRRAGERVDLGLGVNLYCRKGALAGHRFAFEFEVPVFQDLDGPQLETDWLFTLGWQYPF